MLLAAAEHLGLTSQCTMAAITPADLVKFHCVGHARLSVAAFAALHVCQPLLSGCLPPTAALTSLHLFHLSVVISATKDGVKFTTSGDVGTANVTVRQNTTADKVGSVLLRT